MQNVFIYPFCDAHLPLLRFQKQFAREKNIVPILLPYCEDYSKDLSFLDNGARVSYCAIDICEAQADDVFCLTSGDGNVASYKFATKISRKILEQGHKIEVHLNKQELKQLELIFDELHHDPRLLRNQLPEMTVKDVNSARPRLQETPIPIICVGSIMTESNKKDVCLTLASYFIERGKKVSCIMADGLYKHLDLYSLDYDQLLDLDIDSMIRYINAFAFTAYLEKEAEIIIVELPGSMIKYNREFLDSAGAYAYLVSQAININLLVCCTPASCYPEEYYKALGTYFSNKFDVKNIMFHMSNYFVDPNIDMTQDKLLGCYISGNEYSSIINRVNNHSSFAFDFRNETILESIFK